MLGIVYVNVRVGVRVKVTVKVRVQVGVRFSGAFFTDNERSDK